MDAPKVPAKLLQFLTRTAPNKVFLSLFLGVLAGLAYTLIIPIITSVLQFSGDLQIPKVDARPVTVFGFEVSEPKLALLFFSLCGFILVTRTLSQITLQRVALSATRALRLSIYQRIMGMPLSSVERIGASRLHASIANDVPNIMTGAAFVPGILINIATVFGLLAFLIYLDIQVFIFLLAVIVFGIATYRIPMYFGNRCYTQGREEFDQLQESIRSLIYGAKELKLNAAKRDAFLSHALKRPENKIFSNYSTGQLLVTGALNYGNLLSFVAVGVAAFVLRNHFSITSETLVSIVMAMLYVTGPLGIIMNSIGPVLRGSVALRKLNRLLNDMPQEPAGNADARVGFGDVRLEGVCYQYLGGGDEGFSVGPVNLKLNQGQIIFLVGGNGSGKSTLGKLLTLHYLPDSGAIYISDTPVNDRNRAHFRKFISAIYSDFHLFDRLYGLNIEEDQEDVKHYLTYLGLESKVKIEDGRFSTTALSDGQKRRLALIVAYLEDRELYLFDEWAADQDPAFKEFFYKEVIPGLKNRGKTVIVISHDDRYFDIADKLVRMEDGHVVGSEQGSFNADRPVEPQWRNSAPER